MIVQCSATRMVVLASCLTAASAGDSGQWVWSERKQSGSKPSPRCSCAVIATPGNRALFFGGVVDDVSNFL